MADITIDDILHWQRGLIYRAPAGKPADSGIDANVSWAVTIRAAAPILPPLRGGEIVVAPPRLLEQVRESEMVDEATLLRALAGQPIAALMVDPGFSETPVAAPLLVSSGTFPHNAEATLNRLIIERRAELYRIGSDLSRALSTATVSGAGLDQLLDTVRDVIGRPLVLVEPHGAVVARSDDAPDDCPVEPEAVAAGLRAGGQPRLHDVTGRAWLLQPIRPGQEQAGRREMALLVGLAPDASTEPERLAATQSAATLELVLAQALRAGGAGREWSGREPLVAELLTGRLTSRVAAESRARLIGLDPAEPAWVALFTSPVDGLPHRARSALSDQRGRATAALGEHEFAALTTGEDRLDVTIGDLSAAVRRLRRSDPEARVIVSEPVASVALAEVALAQTRVLARLAAAGRLDGEVIRADELGRLGLFGLLLPVAAGTEAGLSDLRARLEGFATSVLGALEEQDRRRHSQLVATLDAWLRHGGALAPTADALGIHRNTLAYRLHRVSEVTGYELDDPQTRFTLQLALDLRTLLAAAG